MPKLLPVSAALLLSGCVVVPVAVPAEPRTCKADGLAAFAGRAANEVTGNEILRASGAARLRWVQPGMVVTMEYSAERVTAFIDANKRIERVVCG